jgi:hypothetical protein
VSAALPAIRALADGGLVLEVAARPGQPRSAVLGVHGTALKVAVAAPPEKGKANDELVRFLAGALGLRRAQVTLLSGQGSRSKAVRLEGLERAALEARLRALLE